MDLSNEIKEIIEGEDVALFMKGTPQMVMCGNSQRALESLRRAGAPVTAVDILPDPRIREELSAISEWPTIPQLFVNGKLVGGADIVTEMYETGELAQALGVDAPEAPAEAPAGAACGASAGGSTPRIWASSPASYISATMSAPPTSSPSTNSCGIVGQFEMADSSCRIRGSGRMSTAAKDAPSESRYCTVRAENPQRGCSGVPFMKRITSCSPIASVMASRMGLVVSLTATPPW